MNGRVNVKGECCKSSGRRSMEFVVQLARVTRDGWGSLQGFDTLRSAYAKRAFEHF